LTSTRRARGATAHRVVLAGIVAVAALAAPFVASSGAAAPRTRASARAATGGPQLTFSRRSSLARLDLRSGRVRPLAIGSFFSATSPSLSPSGRVAFVATACAACAQRLAIVQGRRARRSSPATSVAWLNDRQLLTTAGRGEDTDVWLVGANGERHEIEWLSQAARRIHAENQRGLTVSPSGRSLLFSGEGPSEHHGNYVADLVRHRLRPLRGEGDDAPTLSPDGRTIAFQHVSRRGDWDVCVAPAVPRAGSATGCFSASRGNDRQPAFLPNGRQIVFSSDRAARRSGASSLYLLDLRHGSLRRLTPAGYDATSPAVARDGRSVIFVRRSLVPLR
jgi:Tol biopolymer transport system component